MTDRELLEKAAHELLEALQGLAIKDAIRSHRQSNLRKSMTQNEINCPNKKPTQEEVQLDEWRFRIGWFGRLVLQRKIEWEGMAQKYSKWEDATVGDLRDYYAMHQGNK